MADKVPGKGQRIVMEDRSKLSLSGVLRIQAFDPREILLETALGTLSIKGEQLGIKQLELQNGNVEIEGRVDAMIYHKNQDSMRPSIWNRIFR